MQGVPQQFPFEKDCAQFRHLSHLPGVELYQAHIERYAFEPHTHDAFAIGTVDTGAERFRYRGAQHLAAPGALVLMNPDELHTGEDETPGGWCYRMLYLAPEALEQGFTLVVIDHKRRGSATAKGQRPSVRLMNEAGEDVRIAGTDHAVNISFPVGAVIAVRDNQQVLVGEVLARIPQETSKTRDITGGLPRVAELFEARSPKDAGMLAEVTGTVSFGKDTKGKQRLVITDLDKQEHEYLIAKDKHLLVHDGQVVNKGEMIVDGPVDPHDLLRLLGVEELARYIIDEVQEVYRLQGVKINDKHIEVIVRQMLRRIEIDDPGDTPFIQGEQVERAEVLEENEKAEAAGKKPATFRNMLLGITKASLSTDSFISAASFQETTKVLTEAAMWGKVDHLRGLKENVIMGRLIPAGTGMARYQKIGIQIEAGDAAPAPVVSESSRTPSPPAYAPPAAGDYVLGSNHVLPTAGAARFFSPLGVYDFVKRTNIIATDEETLQRIRELVIPPAWEDVWICAHPTGHLQAVGTDAAGRRQYLYHEHWRSRRDAEKFDRMLSFARQLPRIVVLEAFEADRRDELVGAQDLLGLAQALLVEAEADVAAHREPGKQRVALEQHAAPARGPLDRRLAGPQPPAGRMLQAGDDVLRREDVGRRAVRRSAWVYRTATLRRQEVLAAAVADVLADALLGDAVVN